MTGDILSYRRCARQYGHFTDFGFSPAGSGQLYFGQVVHRTLDRIHQQYKGQIEGKEAGVVPDEGTVEEYFEQVSESLVSRGIYPMSEKAEEKALEYIKRFNSQMGDELYPAVKDTEHQLKRQHEDFVLQGTVDVLTRSAVDDDNPSDWEIWDYKASQVPPEDSQDMQNYRFQMQVYAGLFELKNGDLPSRAVLYFLGERNPEDAMVEISFTRDKIDRAIEIFSNTVNNIEDSRRMESWPAPDPEEAPTEETCADCDLRWDCPAVEGRYPLRTP
ncbi:PD-(D/E)XK nuclease family protein [Salinibaculum salinum]|uniref:PD-(D/E)XK nuclease family protein n=1 Tax=Salinibaculum salinum TaxID=3131996 RepID=UPI0030EBCD6A